MSTNLEPIRKIENVAADAVPAAVAEVLGGWRLRFNHGVKRRPNSVLANSDDGSLEIGAKIARAEAFYAFYGLKARFQLSPASQPEGLDALLAARGYVRVPEAVCVQVRSLPLGAGLPPSPVKVVLSKKPAEALLELYCETEQLAGIQAKAFKEMLGKLPGETVFALAHLGGRPAATGVGVAHGGLLGLFNIATHPSARRRGLGRAVVAALLAWGRARGLASAYLQVAENNTGAQAVYERLGFSTLYHYHYREAP